MNTRNLSFEEMETVKGDGWVACTATLLGTGLFIAGLFAVPGPGWATALYVANAALSPSIAGIGIVSSCTSKGGEVL